MINLLPTLIYVLTTAAGLVLIKLGSVNGAVIELVGGKIAFNISLVNTIGVLLYAVSFVLYTFLIAKHNLGYIIPLTTGLVYVIIFIASLLIFKESVTTFKVLGILLILGGVVLLNLGKY
jgi:multidrug transporter EmrE-like cation transporter